MALLDAVYAEALAPCGDAFTSIALMARAEKSTGLAGWGGARWAEGRFHGRLDELCKGLETDACLTEVGRSRAHSRLHVLLCSRLRQVAYVNRQETVPSIVKPLVGTGLPRAGTTFLHGLLANDPGNWVASAAQAAIPIPPPDGSEVQEDQRTALYERILDFQGFTAPDVTAIHPYAAAAPEECVFLQEAACGMPLGAFYNAPNFSRLVAQSESCADGYAWQKGLMQTLQGAKQTARWLLKAPSHVMNMEALLAAFPDARIFLNHRDPGKVIPSMASLYMKLYGLVSDRSVNPIELGPRLVANWAGIVARLDSWRDAHPAVRVVDVHYKCLIDDPLGTAERLYASFDLELSEDARRAMTLHLDADYHGKGPARSYGLADFGLCEADIEAAFGSYIDRHGIMREGRS